MSEHAILAASASETWEECVGAPAACKGVHRPSSPEADEGTRAHTLAAAWLTGNITAKPLETDEYMGEYVAVYTNAIRRLSAGKLLLVEQRLDISNSTSEPGAMGTGDAIIIDLETCDIYVGDLKYGRGIMVYAERNKQLMKYGQAAVRLAESLFIPKVRNITLGIHQVRRDHLDEWEVSREDLMAAELESRQKGAIAFYLYEHPEELQPVHFSPSEDACRWCAIKKTCGARLAALEGAVYESAVDTFQVLDGKLEVTVAKLPAKGIPSPTTLKRIKEWLAAAADYIEDKLINGEKVPGWKLVQGNPGDRAWKEEKDVLKAAKEAGLKKAALYTDPKLKTPPQVEKMVDKATFAVFQSCITRSDGKPTVVADTDKREAIQIAKAEDFTLFQ